MNAGRRLVVALLALCAVAGCGRTAATPSLASIGQQWVDAWNGNRYGGVAAICDPDAIFWWPVSSPILRGKAEIQQFFTGLQKTWKDVGMQSNGLLVDEAAGKVAVDWTLRATDVATGQPIVRQGVDVLEVRNGFVTAVRGFFDVAGLPTALPSPRARP